MEPVQDVPPRYSALFPSRPSSGQTSLVAASMFSRHLRTSHASLTSIDDHYGGAEDDVEDLEGASLVRCRSVSVDHEEGVRFSDTITRSITPWTRTMNSGRDQIVVTRNVQFRQTTTVSGPGTARLSQSRLGEILDNQLGAVAVGGEMPSIQGTSPEGLEAEPGEEMDCEEEQDSDGEPSISSILRSEASSPGNEPSASGLETTNATGVTPTTAQSVHPTDDVARVKRLFKAGIINVPTRKHTPYMGKKPSLGSFKCRPCDRRWTSSRSIGRHGQYCFTCAQVIVPRQQKAIIA